APEHALDGFGEITRALERPDRAALLDHAGDAAGMALLAIEAEDAGKIARLEAVDHVGRARTLALHAHVERAVVTERKAALRLVELHRGDAYVEDDAVDLALGRRVERGEAAMDEPEPPADLRLQHPAGRNRIGVAVDRDDVGA